MTYRNIWRGNTQIRSSCHPELDSGSRCYPKGFTLIELLVVVLIIGILATVALPQYQIAVAKSRLAAIKPIVLAIKDAEEYYYLNHGEYTSNLSLLEITTSCAKVFDNSLFSCDSHFLIDVISTSHVTKDSSLIRAYYCPKDTTKVSSCTTTNKQLIWTLWLHHSSHPNVQTCEGYTSLGNAVCRSEI